ncbi:hypothetical protein ACM2UU_25375, partial [Escherichia coli]
HRRLACEPGGCSAPVAGYSACLTSFTSSIRFSLHAYVLNVTIGVCFESKRIVMIQPMNASD